MQTYTSDLSDSQWEVVEKLLDNQRKRKYDLRQIWNGILYLLNNGTKWRNLPKQYPRWEIVYYYFKRWNHTGQLQQIQQVLHEQWRLKQGRKGQASLGIIDSQTVKTTKLAEQLTVEVNGYKKLKGRKRHLLVDVTGHILSLQVQPANLLDCQGAWPVIESGPELVKILADQGYEDGWLIEACPAVLGTELEIVRKEENQKGFKVQKKRWLVERSHAWHGEKRRLALDYERKPATTEAFLWISDIHLLLNKLYKN